MGYYPLAAYCKAWREKLRLAAKHKQRVFSDDAKEAMLFFNGPHDWMFQSKYARKRRGGYLASTPNAESENETIGTPSFRMCVNKVAEMRDLIGPFLYSQNPNIVCTPRSPPEPPPQALGIVEPPPDNRPPIMTPMGPQPQPPTPEQMQFQMQMQQYGMFIQQQRDAAQVNGFRSTTLQYVLNYQQVENDKKTHARLALDEAIIKGMGMLVHEAVEDDATGQTKLISAYRSIDNLLIDPDAEAWDGVWWTALRVIEPQWKAEQRFGLPRGSLKGKGKLSEWEKEEEVKADDTDDGKSNQNPVVHSNQPVCYYKLYSKMGMGQDLADTDDDDSPLDQHREQLDELGRNCLVIVCEGVPYFLNLPPHLYGNPEDDDVSDKAVKSDRKSPEAFELPRVPVMQPSMDPMTGAQAVDPMTGQPAEEPAIDPETGEPHTELDPQVFVACQWPIPLWRTGGWMFSPIYFRTVPGQVWPMSLVKPGIPWLRFINWAMSFLATHVRRSCMTIVAIPKAAAEDIKTKILEGKDFTLIELQELTGRKIDELISILQYPEVNNDIWKLVEAAIDGFARATGLNDMLYGQTVHHDRSAAETNAREQNTQIRPDDMANMTEDWLSKVARNEAMMLRWLAELDWITRVIGQLGAQAWQNLIHSASIDDVAMEFDYRVEAGSARKPNKQNRIASINEALQATAQFFEGWAMKTGDVAPINALFQAFGDANDIEMPMLQPPPPPPPQPAPPQQGGGPQPTNGQQTNGHALHP